MDYSRSERGRQGMSSGCRNCSGYLYTTANEERDDMSWQRSGQNNMSNQMGMPQNSPMLNHMNMPSNPPMPNHMNMPSNLPMPNHMNMPWNPPMPNHMGMQWNPPVPNHMGMPWRRPMENYGNMQQYGPMPYYMSYPFPLSMQENDEDERDMERLVSMFPKAAKAIQPAVEEECDRMEYDGSLMFDEYPDRVMMDKIIERIYQTMQPVSEEENETEDSVFATQCRGCNNPSDGLRDLISVMLFEEMHRRRCRRRNCKRWW